MMIKGAKNNPSVLKAIYDQDCQYTRHRQEMQWARFNTAVAIEGGALYSVFTISNLTTFDRAAFWLLATLLIVAISILAVRDAWDSAAYIKRIRAYERPVPFTARSRPWAKWTIGAALLIVFIFNTSGILMLVLHRYELYASG